MMRVHGQFWQEGHRGGRRKHNVNTRGMTLVEVMVAFSIFTLVAGGLLACMLQAEKSARSNLARAYAETTAQSIMEQIVRVPTSTLMNSTQTTVDVLLASLTSTNQTVMEEVQVPWASDASTFTALGGSQGILIDAAYIAATNTVRPERYMKMRINLQRTVNTSDSRVAVVLRYQWEIPDRKSSGGTGIYLTDEIRTVRSSVSSF